MGHGPMAMVEESEIELMPELLEARSRTGDQCKRKVNRPDRGT